MKNPFLKLLHRTTNKQQLFIVSCNTVLYDYKSTSISVLSLLLENKNFSFYGGVFVLLLKVAYSFLSDYKILFTTGQ